MNFNVATSAIFRPILVSDFLADTTSFGEVAQRLSLLSKLRVFVELTHKVDRFAKFGARINTIASIGDPMNSRTNIEDLSFFKELKDDEGNLVKVNNVQQYGANPTYVT